MTRLTSKKLTVTGSDGCGDATLAPTATGLVPARATAGRSLRCDRSVIALLSTHPVEHDGDALTWEFLVGMPGFEPGISGPPDLYGRFSPSPAVVEYPF